VGGRGRAAARRAAALYQQACEGGVAQACADLGVLHRFGAGVGADEARARALLDRACRLGLAQGCFLRDDPVRLAGPTAGDR
jgi:TPR repeat protein